MSHEPTRAELRLAYALIFVTPAFWGVNYLVARWAPGTIAPHALALGRWVVATAILAAFCHAELRAKRDRIAAEGRRTVAARFATNVLVARNEEFYRSCISRH